VSARLSFLGIIISNAMSKTPTDVKGVLAIIMASLTTSRVTATISIAVSYAILMLFFTGAT